jgi:AcrR family transcriptional regulator
MERTSNVTGPSRTAARTQGERTAATVAALVSTARRLFASQGFAAIGTEQIAREAGVSRGALYHQFADKTELFAAVLDQAEHDIAELILRAVTGIDPNDTEALLLAGGDAFLDACSEPGLRLIVLIDGPSVLGWTRWREICLRHSVGLISALLADGIERGTIPSQPVEPLTHVLVGAVDEAALYVAEADDPTRARGDMDGVLRRIVRAVTTP